MKYSTSYPLPLTVATHSQQRCGLKDKEYIHALRASCHNTGCNGVVNGSEFSKGAMVMEGGVLVTCKT